MRTVATNAVEAIDLVRALSEGRGPKRVLLTEPWRPFTAPVPRAKVAYEDSLSYALPTLITGRSKPRATVREFATTNPGRFTTEQFAAYADITTFKASGWLTAASKAPDSTLEIVGKDGRKNIWSFK